MSDPRTPPDPTPHDPEPGTEPIDIRELRTLSTLLRRLPDPEPPDDLRLRVMEQVRREPLGVEPARARFRPQQGLAAALAAGIAGFFLLSSPQGELPGTAARQLVPSPGRSSSEGAANVVMRVKSRPPTSEIAFAAPAPSPGSQDFFAGDRLLASSEPASPNPLPPLDQRLDRQIDQMLHQPDAFFRRLERIRENDRYLARLAARSAERGDSAAVALRVRNNQHPLAPKIAEQFLRASLAQSLSQPRRVRHSIPTTLQHRAPTPSPGTPIFAH